jgi:hypothetical protein
MKDGVVPEYTRLMNTLKAFDGIPGEYARDARMETPIGPERRYALDYGIQLQIERGAAGTDPAASGFTKAFGVPFTEVALALGKAGGITKALRDDFTYPQRAGRRESVHYLQRARELSSQLEEVRELAQPFLNALPKQAFQDFQEIEDYVRTRTAKDLSRPPIPTDRSLISAATMLSSIIRETHEAWGHRIEAEVHAPAKRTSK